MVAKIVEVIKKIKRINERTNEIAKLYGTESKIYGDYVSRISSLFKEGEYRESKHGIIQLSRSKSFYENVNVEKLERVEQLPTMGQMLKKARASLIEDNGVGYNPPRFSVIERAKDMDYIRMNIEENIDFLYSFKEGESIKEKLRTKGKKSYEELKSIIDEINELKSNSKLSLVNPFEDLSWITINQ